MGKLAILTAARSGEVRAATWSEFDLDAALWIIEAAYRRGDLLDKRAMLMQAWSDFWFDSWHELIVFMHNGLAPPTAKTG